MAKAIEEVTDSETTTSEDASSNQTDKVELENMPADQTVQVMVTMPAGLKLKALAAADQKDYTLARYVRELVANELDYDLPDTIRTRSKKYATEEERVAAQKAKSKKRNSLIKMLLQKYKDGDIDLDDLDDDDDDE